MKTGFRQKFPEEIELELKCSELAILRTRHAEALSVLHKLQDEIAKFERAYDQTLGRRLAELERIEAEISRLTGYSASDSHQSRTTSGASAESSKRGSTPKGRGTSEEQDIKALYREVAKAIHPDLDAGSGESDRHELMSRANRAYAQQDRRALQEILRNWNNSPDQVEGADIGAKLVRVIRDLAWERQEIEAVKAQVEELKGSYVCRFKLRVDNDLARGSDLFAEMIAAADLNIARALKRLAALQGERPAPRAPKAPRQEKREIVFPDQDFTGTVYLRDRSSINFSHWKKFGPARGRLEIGVDQALRLDVKAPAAANLAQMQKLRPDDLQALFLYEVGDHDLDHIVHLTGLEELYLSGLRLTDAALSGISVLTNLKRLYLYQTVITDDGLVHLQRLPALKGLTSSGNSITDEGLAVFQKAIPGVKTVSFPWRR